jgi:hypothetical protein
MTQNLRQITHPALDVSHSITYRSVLRSTHHFLCCALLACAVLALLHLQDGLAPDEEWPSDEGGVRDEEDLPIEALLDTEEDEDLSLAALLRKRMQQV